MTLVLALGLPPPATGVVPLAQACCAVAGGREAEGTVPEAPARTPAPRRPPSLSLPPAAEAALGALGYSAASLLRREAALAVAVAAAALGAPLKEVDGASPARLLQAWGPPGGGAPPARTAAAAAAAAAARPTLGPPGGPPPARASALLLTRLVSAGAAAGGGAGAAVAPAAAAALSLLAAPTAASHPPPLPPRAWADLFSISEPALTAAVAAATRAAAGRAAGVAVSAAVAGGRPDGAALPAALALAPPALAARVTALLAAWQDACGGHPAAWEVGAWLPAAVEASEVPRRRRRRCARFGFAPAPLLHRLLGRPPPPAAPGAPWFNAPPDQLSADAMPALARALGRLPAGAHGARGGGGGGARRVLLGRPDVLHAALVVCLSPPGRGGGAGGAPEGGGGGGGDARRAARAGAAAVAAAAVSRAPGEAGALAAALMLLASSDSGQAAWGGAAGRLPAPSLPAPLSAPRFWWLASVALPLAGLEAGWGAGGEADTAAATAVLQRVGEARPPPGPGACDGDGAADPRIPARRLVVAWLASRGEGGLAEALVRGWR